MYYLPCCRSCCVLLSCLLLPTVLLSSLPTPLLVSAAHPTAYLGCSPLLLVLLVADRPTRCFPARPTHHFLPCSSLPARSSLRFPLVTTCNAYHSPSRPTHSLPSTLYLHPCTNRTSYVVPHLDRRCSHHACARTLIARLSPHSAACPLIPALLLITTHLCPCIVAVCSLQSAQYTTN
jgi:hypothetical protein